MAAGDLWKNNVPQTPDGGDGDELFALINGADDGDLIEIDPATEIIVPNAPGLINARSGSAAQTALEDAWDTAVAAWDVGDDGPINYAAIFRSAPIQALIPAAVIRIQARGWAVADDTCVTSANDAAMPVLAANDSLVNHNIIQMQLGTRYIQFRGIRFRQDADQVGSSWNSYITTYPTSIELNQATYGQEDMSDWLIFWQCRFLAFTGCGQNIALIVHEGKKLFIRGCEQEPVGADGGSGDGFWISSLASEGPIVKDNCKASGGGEFLGYGGHGGLYGFTELVDDEVQPHGYTVTRSEIYRPESFQNFAPVNSGILYKNALETTYMDGLLLDGNYIHDMPAKGGGQRFLFANKHSILGQESLAYLACRNYVYRNLVIHSIEGLWLISESTTVAASPPMENFTLENCCIFDVDSTQWGTADGSDYVFSVGGQPANVTIRNCIIDVTSIYGFLAIQNPFPHDTEFLVNWTFENNIILLPGDHGQEFVGQHSDSTTFIGAPISTYIGSIAPGNRSRGGFFDIACNGTFTFENNVYVSVPHTFDNHYGQWGAHAGGGYVTPGPNLESTNWIMRGTSGRAAALALLRDPENATLTDRDYRLTEAAAAVYIDGDDNPIGPDYSAMFDAMGEDRWPFSWMPEDEEEEPDPPVVSGFSVPFLW